MGSHQRQNSRPHLTLPSTPGQSCPRLESGAEQPADQDGETYLGHGDIGFFEGGDRRYPGFDEHPAYLRSEPQTTPPELRHPVSAGTQPHGYGLSFLEGQHLHRARPRSQTVPSQPGINTRHQHHPYQIQVRNVNEYGTIGYGQGHDLSGQTSGPHPFGSSNIFGSPHLPATHPFDNLDVPHSATSSEVGFHQFFEQCDGGSDILSFMLAHSTAGLNFSELLSEPETPQSNTSTDTSSIMSSPSAAGSHIGHSFDREDHPQTPDFISSTTPALDPSSDTVCVQTLGGSLSEAQHHVRSAMDRARSDFGVEIQEFTDPTGLRSIRIFDASSAVSEVTRVGRVAKTSVEENATKRRTSAPTFICWHLDCRQTFTARHNAINHEYSHLGIKRYRCQYYSICEGAFVTKSDAKRHEKKCRGRPPDSDTPNDSKASSRHSGPNYISDANVSCEAQEHDFSFFIRSPPTFFPESSS
ncbi:hypothetical protein Moror_8234 [Moniliophthora roreri MCA 2997]|uniref:C2H2-type domain-containing protein n=1 Tax=Moniliophthora roreri (strain MCA 2997) TaxID=1381753 RepID=V2YRF5_MONRO|nr:hypothetical protein Moror_8234 [Moniliophthora roreri MCA 2997]